MIVDAVDSEGVTPLPVTMLGVTVPIQSSVCVPVGGEAFENEVDQFVTVPEPPVPAGKFIAATGDVLAGPVAVTVQPPVVLATLTRV